MPGVRPWAEARVCSWRGRSTQPMPGMVQAGCMRKRCDPDAGAAGSVARVRGRVGATRRAVSTLRLMLSASNDSALGSDCDRLHPSQRSGREAQAQAQLPDAGPEDGPYLEPRQPSLMSPFRGSAQPRSAPRDAAWRRVRKSQRGPVTRPARPRCAPATSGGPPPPPVTREGTE